MTAHSLLLGLGTALMPANLFACFAGVLLGTLVGVLPGLGPVTAIALLLPFTFTLPPTTAIVVLSGLYYGAQYGGSTSAILLNLPGEASSAVTCVDGHALARAGRGGFALAVAAWASFAGGTIGTLLIAIASEPMAAMTGALTAADFAAVMALGLAIAIAVEVAAPVKATVMAVAGLALGAVGTDVATGSERWTFNVVALYDGIGFLPLAIGLFGFADIIETLATGGGVQPVPFRPDGTSAAPGEIRRTVFATARGTAVGSVLGLLPGGGPTLASFVAYAAERTFASGRAELGVGAVEGVAGPEAANNAAAQTSFVPLLLLGVPSNAVVALLLGALIVQGVQPGPTLMTKQPELFWGLIVSMWIGNLLLLALNLPLVGIWARLLRVPYAVLYPATIALGCTGLFAVSRSTFDLILAAAFGVAGWWLKRGGFPVSTLLLGFVLSRPLEDSVMRGLALARGDAMTFVRSPVSATALALGVLVLSLARARRMSSALPPRREPGDDDGRRG